MSLNYMCYSTFNVQDTNSRLAILRRDRHDLFYQSFCLHDAEELYVFDKEIVSSFGIDARSWFFVNIDKTRISEIPELSNLLYTTFGRKNIIVLFQGEMLSSPLTCYFTGDKVHADSIVSDILIRFPEFFNCRHSRPFVKIPCNADKQVAERYGIVPKSCFFMTISRFRKGHVQDMPMIASEIYSRRGDAQMVILFEGELVISLDADHTVDWVERLKVLSR